MNHPVLGKERLHAGGDRRSMNRSIRNVKKCFFESGLSKNFMILVEYDDVSKIITIILDYFHWLNSLCNFYLFCDKW
jgi:hypothetical protein